LADFNYRYELILYDSGSSFALMDVNKDIIFSKTYLGKSFNNIEWSSDSTFFVATTENNVYIYNMFDFSVKQWSNFTRIKVN